MDYQRIYNQIIERGSQRLLKGYGENHHIIPKCMGGTDTQDNIVRLTAREHFICHWLLVRIYPTEAQLNVAALLMSTRKGVRVPARAYQEFREGHAAYMSNIERTPEWNKNNSNAKRGKKLSEEHKRKMSEARKGKKRGNYNTKLSGGVEVINNLDIIIQLYKEGKSLHSIKETLNLNVSTPTISKYIKQHSTGDIDRKYGQKYGHSKLLKYSKEVLVDFYTNNISARQVGKKYGVDVLTVKRFIKREKERREGGV